MLAKVNMEIKGSLAKNPVVRYTTGGTAICDFALVYNPFPIKDPRNIPVWFNCIAFKALAEDIGLTFKKGSGVHIVKCTPKVERWKDKNTGDQREKLVWTVWELEGLDEPDEIEPEEPGEPSYASDDELPY